MGLTMRFYDKPTAKAGGKESGDQRGRNVQANCGGAHGLCPDCAYAGRTKGCGRVFSLPSTWK